MPDMAFRFRRNLTYVHRRFREWRMLWKGIASTDHPVPALDEYRQVHLGNAKHPGKCLFLIASTKLLDQIGLSGADCAGGMMDGYTELLERVGIEQKKAAKNVVGLFMPLIHKYRHGMKIK